MNPRSTSEDLFENTRMSFGEHLEELRKVLVKALLGVAIGTAIGIYFSSDVVRILKAPLVRALEKYQQQQDQLRLTGAGGWLPPDLQPWLDERQSPESVFVDPGQLISAIRAIEPEFLKNVDVSAYQLVVKNVKPDQAVRLCQRLAIRTGEPASAEQKLQVIWELIPPADQAVIERIGRAAEATASDLSEITRILNGVMSRAELNQSAAFAAHLAAPSEAARWLLGSTERNPLHEMAVALQSQPDDDTTRRLNRALLAIVFPQELQPLRQELIPLQIWREVNVQPQALSVIEPFMIWMKAGIICGLVLSSPWVFYQVWTFVAAGLYPHEKNYVYLYLPISLGLFFGGILLAYFFVFDPVLQFLFSFNAELGISPETRINDWLGFFMFLPLGFGIAFQLPLVMLLLNRLGVLSVEAYLAKWRIAIMVIFVVAMVLTPADPISMLLMAFPLTLLYFVGIALCRWMPGRRPHPFGEIPEPG